MKHLHTNGKKKKKREDPGVDFIKQFMPILFAQIYSNLAS
jgi:hypothetical protein